MPVSPDYMVYGPTPEDFDPMSWRSTKVKWNWRAYLTMEEEATLKRADDAKAVWLELNRDRAAITNRAIQRAKADATKEHPGGPGRKRSSVAADKNRDTCRPHRRAQ